jgi:sugar fermentation stimulation protein A
MRFDPPLVAGHLLHREKRFLVHVRLSDGRQVVAHCPNTGSMRGCLGDGWPVRLSAAASRRRKLAWTLEMVHDSRCWIAVNTHRANHLAAAAIGDGTVSELAGWPSLRREVVTDGGRRLDLRLEDDSRRCWVEVKSVTMVDAAGRYAFPDAVTRRGLAHLETLASLRRHGDHAAMLFIILRSEGHRFAPAADIDPAYAAALRRARDRGVEVLAYRAEVSPEELRVVERVEVEV